jgi:hypothetical protein
VWWALAVLACAVILPSCEDSAVFAPSDGSMEIDAVPAVVTIDTEAQDPTATSTIRVQLFDADGFAASGRTVFFSATGGVLASSGNAAEGVETDENGIALDQLTVREGDPETIEVTARSGALSATVTVTKTELTGEIVVTAQTSTFNLDPDNGPTTGSTRIDARVFDTQGNPVEGVEVIFSSDGGTLDIDEPVVTNAAGLAQNVLRVGVADAPGVTVTARSGGLEGEIDIAVLLPGQTPPTAVLTANPASGQAVVGQDVTFSGTTSSDPENDISCYRFTFTAAAVAASPELTGTTITQTQPTLAAITFDEPLTTNVTLLVTDDSGPGFPCSNGTQFESFDEATISYQVRCAAPTAVAEIETNNDTTTPFDVVLDASQSTAPGSATVQYRWTCNNEANSQPTGVQVTCSYTNPGTKTVTLRVTNDSACGSQFDEDQIQVTVPGTP